MYQFCTDHVHDHVRALIVEKIRYLLHPYGQNVPNVTTSQDIYEGEAPVTTTLLESPLSYAVECAKRGENCPRPLTAQQQERFKRRECVVCGNDVSARRGDAKTCSKTCRNKLSNPPNNGRRTIERIKGKGVLFDVRPHLDPEVMRYRLKII